MDVRRKKGMRSFTISRVFDRHTRAVAAAVGLLLATLTPALAPVFASAAQLTERSVALTNASVSATGVSYAFTFTADNASAGGIAVEFCSNTPLVGEACTAPGNSFSVSSGNVTGGTKYGTWTANRAFITKSVASGANTFTLTGVTNPTVAGTLYARIVTYDTDAHAGAYQSATLGTGVVDNGSVAFAITSTVAVSGDVLEALTFCVSGSDLTGTDCATGYSAPVLTLGEDVGDGVKALISTEVSTADVYTKISTNAVKGAVVSLKSTAGDNDGTPCAGLALNGTGACNIAAAGTTGTFDENDPDAKFGLIIDAPTSGANGTINIASGYSATDYRLNGAGVISTYGDPIYNTDEGYANDRNTKLTFAAKSAANTPAGKYSTSISLIATGTF